MPHEIRADYNRDTIVVYQAYAPAIAEPALQAGRFVPPWSTGRMTWVKPSFLWMMERSNWGRKAGQEVTLAVRLTRSGWDRALSLGILTHAEAALYGDADHWRDQLDQSPVRVQWDPERALDGSKLEHRSIQVGLARGLAEEYANAWVVGLTDLRPLVRRIRDFRDRGEKSRARALLPPEKVYPVPPEVERRLGMR